MPLPATFYAKVGSNPAWLGSIYVGITGRKNTQVR